VLAELENEAGSQFDPKVVEAFRDLLASKGEQG
jgi:HD-GYP domain-containing protein (c-di-GMP phosphodiesterase class II)